MTVDRQQGALLSAVAAAAVLLGWHLHRRCGNPDVNYGDLDGKHDIPLLDQLQARRPYRGLVALPTSPERLSH